MRLDSGTDDQFAPARRFGFLITGKGGERAQVVVDAEVMAPLQVGNQPDPDAARAAGVDATRAARAKKNRPPRNEAQRAKGITPALRANRLAQRIESRDQLVLGVSSARLG